MEDHPRSVDMMRALRFLCLGLEADELCARCDGHSHQPEVCQGPTLESLSSICLNMASHRSAVLEVGPSIFLGAGELVMGKP